MRMIWRSESRPMGIRVGTSALGIALVLAVFATGPGLAWADSALEATQLVERAKFTIENFAADPNMTAFHKLVQRAKGVFVAQIGRATRLNSSHIQKSRMPSSA